MASWRLAQRQESAFHLSGAVPWDGASVKTKLSPRAYDPRRKGKLAAYPTRLNQLGNRRRVVEDGGGAAGVVEKFEGRVDT
jgi:hypothetical protein